MSDSFFSGDGFISIFFLLFIVAFVAILGMILAQMSIVNAKKI